MANQNVRVLPKTYFIGSVDTYMKNRRDRLPDAKFEPVEVNNKAERDTKQLLAAGSIVARRDFSVKLYTEADLDSCLDENGHVKPFFRAGF